MAKPYLYKKFEQIVIPNKEHVKYAQGTRQCCQNTHVYIAIKLNELENHK